MSTTIDENVVELRFDNAQFEQGVRQSMNSIENLENQLNISEGAERFKMQFSGMQIVAATVISEITKSAMNLGKTINDLIFGQIKSGGMSRASNIEAAKFMLEGLGVTWKEIEEDINYGVADTAYGLDAAAKAASQLVASGVKFGNESNQMKNTLRAISGVAAMTNSTYEDTADIFTTIAGQGKLMTMQLRQLESRGLNAAAVLAKELGKTEAEVRELVTDGGISFTMFADAMDSAFGEHAKAANKTLTGVLANIRSALSKIGADFYTPIIENEGHLVSMLDKIRLILNLVRKYIKPSVETLAKIVNGAISKIDSKLQTLYRNVTEMDWLEGVTNTTQQLSDNLKNFINSIKTGMVNVLELVLRIITPITQAFREIFPKKTLNDMTNFNNSFSEFIKSLWLSKDGMTNLKYTFEGIFSVIKIIRDVIISVIKAILPFTANCKNLFEVILSITGKIGYIITQFSKWIEKTGILNSITKVLIIIFRELSDKIGYALKFLAKFIDNVFTIENINKIINTIVRSLDVFYNLIVKKLTRALNKLVEIVFNLWNKLKMLYQTTKQLIYEVKRNGKSILSDLLKKFSIFKKIVYKNVILPLKHFLKALDSKTVLAFAMSIAALMNAFSVVKIVKNITKLTNSMSRFFDTLANGFTIKETSNPADSLIKLAASIFLVAQAAKTISEIDKDDIEDVMQTLAIVLGMMTGAYVLMAVVNKLTQITSVAQTIKELSVALSVLAVGLTFFISSLIRLRDLDWWDLNEGIWKLAALGAELIVITGLMNLVSRGANIRNMISASLVIAALGLSMGSIAEAVNKLGSLDVESVNKAAIGMFEVCASLAVLAAGTSNLKLTGVAALFILVKSLNQLMPSMIQLSDYFKQFSMDDLIIQFRKYKVVVEEMAAMLLISAAIFGGLQIGSQFGSFASGIIKLIIGLALLVEVCKLINNNQESVEGAVPVLKEFIKMIAVLELLSIFTAKANMTGFASSLNGIAITVAVLGGIAFLLGKVGENNKSLEEGVAAVKALVAMIVALEVVSAVGRNISKSNLIATMATLVIISGTMVLLTKNMQSARQMITAAISFATVIAAYAGTIISINEFARRINEGVSIGIAEIVGIMATIAILAGTLVVLSRYDWKNIAASGLAMSGAITSVSLLLMGLAILVSSVDTLDLVTGIAGLFGVIGILGLLSLDLAYLAQFDWKNIAASGAAITSAVISIISILEMLSKVSNISEEAVVGLIPALLSFSILAVAIGLISTLFENVDWKSLIATSASASIALIAITGMLFILSKTGNINLKSIIKIGVGLGALYATGLVLQALTQQDWKAYAGTAVAVSSTLVAISLLMIALGSLRSTGGSGLKTLLTLIPALVTVGIVTNMLNEIANNDWKKIGLSALAMISTLGLIIILMQTLSSMSGFASTGFINPYPFYSALAVCGIMLSIASAISLLSLLPLKQTIAATAELAAILYMLSMVGQILGKNAEIIAANSANLIKTLVVLAGVSATMLIVAGILALVAIQPWDNILKAVITFGAVAVALAFVIKTIQTITAGTGLLVIAAGLLAIGLSLIPLATNVNKLAVSIAVLSYAQIGNIVSNLYGLKDAINNLAGVNTVIDEVAPGLINLGSALSTITNSITPIISQGAEVIKTRGYDSFKTAGSFCIDGLRAGLVSNNPGILTSIGNIASSIFDKFCQVLGIHSPSTKFASASKFMIAGAVKGLADNQQRVYNATKQIGTNAVLSEVDGMAEGQDKYGAAAAEIVEDVATGKTSDIEDTAKEAGTDIGETYAEATVDAIEDTFTVNDMSDAAKALYEQLSVMDDANMIGQTLGANYMLGVQAGINEGSLETFGFEDTQAIYAFDKLVEEMQTADMYIADGAISLEEYNAILNDLKDQHPEFADELAEGSREAVLAVADYREEFSQLNKDARDAENLLNIADGWNKFGDNFKHVTVPAVVNWIKDVAEESGLSDMFNIEGYVDFDMSEFMSDMDYATEETSELDRLLSELGVKTDSEKETDELRMQLEEIEVQAMATAQALWYMDNYGHADPESDMYKNTMAQLEEYKTRIQELRDQISAGGTSYDDVADSTDEATKAAEKYADAMDDLKDSIEDALKSNEHFDRTVTDSSKTIISNLKSQVRGTTEWANDLVKLASRGASQALVEELGEMGSEGYSMLQAYLTMTDEQLSEVNDIYDNRATLEKQVLARVNASYALAGNQNAISYLKSLGYSLEQAKQLVEESAAEADKQFNENLVKFADVEPYTDEYNELKTYFQELGYTTKDVATMVEQANGNIAVSLRNLEMEEAFKKIEAAYFSMYSIISDASDPFSEFSRSFEISKKDLFKNLNSQVAGFAEWSNKLIILANRGVTRGIIGALEEAGPESVDKVDAMLDMTAEELEKYIELWEGTESNIEDTSQSMMMALAITGDEDAIKYFETLGLSIDDVKAQAEALDSQTMHLTNMKNAAKAVQEEFTDLYDTIKGQIDIFEEFDTSAELSGDELLENMQSQVEGVKEWSKNIAELAGRGMSEELLKELSNLGPDGYEKVAAFMDMTDDQIREANDLYAESLALPASASGEIMSSYAKAGDQAAADFINSLGVSASNAEAVGEAFVEAFSMGIESNAEYAQLSGSELMEGFMVGLDKMGVTVNDTATTLSTNLLDSMRATLGIHSPSTETTAMGKHLCEGFNKGINDHTKGVVNTAIDMGKNIVNGLMNGINTQVNSAYSSITLFANKILDTAKRVLGINSPSRKFAEIGMYSVMGMCEGIKKYAYMATDAANDLSEDTINVVQDAIKSILDIINSDDEGFVIRPILDLSNVQEGANKISSMFKQKELAMAFDADDAINQNGGKVNAGGSIVFNQYNTSPKALDRIEIYRQTKNQFSQLRGMVTT